MYAMVHRVAGGSDGGLKQPSFEFHHTQSFVLDMQPWARVAHSYCSVHVNSAFYPPWDGKMSITFQAK